MNEIYNLRGEFIEKSIEIENTISRLIVWHFNINKSDFFNNFEIFTNKLISANIKKNYFKKIRIYETVEFKEKYNIEEFEKELDEFIEIRNKFAHFIFFNNAISSFKPGRLEDNSGYKLDKETLTDEYIENKRKIFKNIKNKLASIQYKMIKDDSDQAMREEGEDIVSKSQNFLETQKSNEKLKKIREERLNDFIGYVEEEIGKAEQKLKKDFENIKKNIK